MAKLGSISVGGQKRTYNAKVTLLIKNRKVRMTNQSARSGPAALAHSWKCLACDSCNSKEATSCSTCGCPALATVSEIERFRPAGPVLVQDVQQQDAAHQDATREALSSSRYSYWYWASIGVFILSLLVSNGTGFYMLMMGWAALQYSLAWFANPLLISAFVLGRPTSNPDRGVGLCMGRLP